MPIHIISQLSENQIESDIASYLGLITPLWSKRFRLIKVDEQTTGADKLFNRFVPIYMQFKVSHGLNPGGTILQRFQNAPLSKIVSYRKTNNLSGNPILYFQLRKQAKTAKDLQHNILYDMHKPPFQYAMYVAPLTLEGKEYEELMNVNWLYRFFPPEPFRFQDQDILDPSTLKNFSLGINPFLRHHISIPPHTKVNTHNHHYSYSVSGGDLAWHGGKTFEEDYRLSVQLNKILSNFYGNDNAGISEAEFIRYINQFNKENGIAQAEINNSDRQFSALQIIRNFAATLKILYNISLMLLIQPKK